MFYFFQQLKVHDNENTMESEKQSLLHPTTINIQSWPNHKQQRGRTKLNICLKISLVFLSVFITVALLLCWLWSYPVTTLNSVLPSQVTFSFSHRSQHVLVAWNRSNDDFRYQERRTVGADQGNITLTLTILLRKEYITVGDRLFCESVVDYPQLYTAVHSLNTAVLTDRGNKWCNGLVWMGEFVDICTHQNIPFSLLIDGDVVPLQNFTPSFENKTIDDSGFKCKSITKLPLLGNINGRVNTEQPIAIRSSGKFTTRLPKKMPCLFIHGAGRFKNKDIFKVTDSFISYWGNISDVTPQCSSHRFIKWNSVDTGWDNMELQRNMCRVATAGNSDKMIKNLKIFTHSMGNVVMAAALHNKFCFLDHDSQWFAAQAPWRGSSIADKISCFCDKTCSIFDLPKFLPSDIIKFTKYCHKNGTLTRSYVTMKTDYVSPTGITYDDLIKTVRKTVTGSMCGQSSWGGFQDWPVSVELTILQKATGLDWPNDGMVALSSCNVTGSFSTNYTSRFYTGYMNHAEGTCRYGISKCKSNAHHPCLWYANA